MMKEKEIRKLIERFLEGETTNAEEQILYEYFNNINIAADLEPYREMFRWYAAGMPPKRRSHFLAKRILGIAASLLLLIAVGFSIWQYQKQQEEYALYEGSYIIRDGKKLTDIKQILPELKATEQEVVDMLKQQNTNQEIPTI